MDSRSNYSPTPSNLVVLDMDCNDRRSIVPLDADRIIGGCHAQGNNVASELKSSSSTVKIDSLCIKLGIVKEKTDSQKCRHFSMRGYAARMREIRGNNFLPSLELPPIEVPHFRYWLCQRCSRNCGTPHTSHETALVSVSDQSVVQPCARSCPSQDCDGAVVLPFGEGTSGLKPVESRNDDESILAALGGANEIQSSQAIPAIAEASVELSKVSSIDTNAAAEAKAGAPGKKRSNDLRAHEDPQQANSVKETITSLVGPPVHSGQQNDYPSGHPRRKARKVRLLKELLCGNTKSQRQKKEKSPPCLVPRSSSPLAASSQIKRKKPHGQDCRSVDITSPGCAGKKAKSSKGNAVAKTSMVEHSRDPGAAEGGRSTDKYQWNKHGTQRSSILGKVGSDPVTAWRSIFSDMGRADNQVIASSCASRPIHDLSKGRFTEPNSNLMPPPQPEKKFNAFKKISRNPLRSKFFGEDLRRINVFGSRVKDHQSDMDLGLGLSLNYDPQAQVHSLSSMLNRTPSQDHTRKTGFFFGESSISHRILSDSKSKEGSVCEDRDRHVPRRPLLQEQRHYTQLSHGSCSGHQKLDFSDPYNKRNGGVRGYSEVMRAHDHQRQEKMFSIRRSDEREIVELMAKNQYERNLCEARSYCPPGDRNDNGIPNTLGVLRVNRNEGMQLSHQEYLSMIRPPSSSIATISMMPTSENVGPTTMRNPTAGFFHQQQVPGFTMFDSFSQCQKQPSSGIRISDSGAQKHHNSCYHHVSKGNNKIAHPHVYTPTNMQVLETFNKYRNGTRQNEAAGDVFSTVPTSMPFGQSHANFSDKKKGKSIMDLDLNVVAPNVVEEQNNLEPLDWTPTEYQPYLAKDKRMELNPKHTCSLDSSYSNEAIPAMQLLSLMDAGKSSHPFSIDGRKFITKPFSPCYNHCSSTMTAKMNSMDNPNFPYSGLRPGMQKPTTNSSHFLSPLGSSFSSAVGSSFPCVFRTHQNVKSHSSHTRQLHHTSQEEKSRGASSASMNHSCRPGDSFVFPLPWHATEDRSEHVILGAQGSFGPRNGPSGTEICTTNQNPADFSTPGPENEYMINVEDLIFRGEVSYKGRSAWENANGPKRQKRS